MFIGTSKYLLTEETTNESTQAPPEASVYVVGPAVWKVSKSNLNAQISKMKYYGTLVFEVWRCHPSQT